MSPTYRKLLTAEQAHIVRLLVERLVISPTGADVRLQVTGLAILMRKLGGIGAEARRAA